MYYLAWENCSIYLNALFCFFWKYVYNLAWENCLIYLNTLFFRFSKLKAMNDLRLGQKIIYIVWILHSFPPLILVLSGCPHLETGRYQAGESNVVNVDCIGLN